MNALYNKAIKLLAQRDHSEYELRRKLTTPSLFNNHSSSTIITDLSLVDQIIKRCYDNGWLDDQAYAEKFVIMRSAKGYGSQRIRLELNQRGISKDIVYNALNECNIDWYELAAKTAIRRFGDVLSLEWKAKAKVQRYLMQRGFCQEEIQSVFEKEFY